MGHMGEIQEDVSINRREKKIREKTMIINGVIQEEFSAGKNLLGRRQWIYMVNGG
jgi:hypothetical protein